jgi:GAF domain-containing protein
VRLTPAESLEKSGIVFAGTVYDLHAAQFESVVGDRASVVLKEAHFTADRVWRGDVGSDVVLLTGSSDCDYQFEQGRTYLVYAVVDPATGYFTASNCSPTKRIELADDDLRLLPPSRQFAKPLFRRELTHTRLPLMALIGAALGGAVAATLLLQGLRRLRQSPAE